MDDERELFDIIYSTFIEKGYESKWKSEIFLESIKPLFEAGIEQPNHQLDELSRDPDKQIPFILMLDLLKKLKLDNTIQMLKQEIGLEENLLDYMKENASSEPILLKYIKSYQETAQKTDPDLLLHHTPETVLEDSNNSTTAMTTFYETAISEENFKNLSEEIGNLELTADQLCPEPEK